MVIAGTTQVTCCGDVPELASKPLSQTRSISLRCLEIFAGMLARNYSSIPHEPDIIMQDQRWESARRMIANRSQRCFFFFSAQRAFANSDKRLRPAAVIPPLAGSGMVCLATGLSALACGLAVSFRAAHLARRASATLFLKAGLTLRRPLVPACFTPDFFSGTSGVFTAAVFS